MSPMLLIMLIYAIGFILGGVYCSVHLSYGVEEFLDPEPVVARGILGTIFWPLLIPYVAFLAIRFLAQWFRLIIQRARQPQYPQPYSQTPTPPTPFKELL